MAGTASVAGEVFVDALPYFDQGYDAAGVREAVSKRALLPCCLKATAGCRRRLAPEPFNPGFDHNRELYTTEFLFVCLFICLVFLMSSFLILSIVVAQREPQHFNLTATSNSASNVLIPDPVEITMSSANILVHGESCLILSVSLSITIATRRTQS